MVDHEAALSERLLAYLRGRPDVTIIGDPAAGRERRVPTVSFVVDGQSSESVVRVVDPSGIGIRFGDSHSERLVDCMDLASGDGVIRVSAVHCNTLHEIGRLIERLESCADRPPEPHLQPAAPA